MKILILLLRILLGAVGLLVLVRIALLLVKTAREANQHSAVAYYDPTVFVVVGLLLLPFALLGLRYAVNYVRRMAGRR